MHPQAPWTRWCSQAIDPVAVAVHPCQQPSCRILCWSTAVLVKVLERGGCIPCVDKCLQIQPRRELCTPICNCSERVFPGLATLWSCDVVKMVNNARGAIRLSSNRDTKCKPMLVNNANMRYINPCLSHLTIHHLVWMCFLQPPLFLCQVKYYVLYICADTQTL